MSWGNTSDGPDLWMHGPWIVLERVHAGSLGGTPDANIAPGSGDRGFIAAGNPRLRPDSPLVDTGVGAPDGGMGTLDADGLARLRGVAVDVGAFERDPEASEHDLLFADGFEPTA